MPINIKKNSLSYKDENGNFHSLEMINGGGGGSVEIDPTLSIEGAAADAKAVGDKCIQLKEDLDSLEAKQGTIEVSEKGYDFYNLGQTENKLYIIDNGFLSYVPKVIYGENRFPIITSDCFTKSSPYLGIDFKEKDNRILYLNGTSTSGGIISYFKYNNDYNIDIEDVGLSVNDIVVLKCYASGNIPNSSVVLRMYCLDGSKNTLLTKQIFPQSQIDKELEFSIPENTKYIWLCFAVIAGTTVDGKIFPCLIKKNESVVDISDGMILDSENSSVSVFPCKANLIYNKNLQTYIDEHSGGVTPEDVYGLLTYVTPEQFGAIGTSYVDDTNAFKQCISYAKENHLPIKANNKYLLSEKIVIDYQEADFYAGTLKFVGEDSYLQIDCMNSTFKIDNIHTDFAGIMLVGDTSRCVHNRIEVNNITSNHHGIILWSKNKPVYQNEIRFMWLWGGANIGDYAITSELYDNAEFVTENNFYGGHCQRFEWVWYGEGGNSKFYSIHCEGEILGGFYFPSDCNCIILGDRHAEAARDGYHAFIKIGNGIKKPYQHNSVGNAQLRFISSTQLPINEIDVSENPKTYIKNDGSIGSLNYRGIGVIDCLITSGLLEVGSNDSNYNLLSTGAYIFGDRIILIPSQKRSYTVNESVLDLRLSDSNLKILPTSFIAGTSISEIYLHPSYCWIGYNEFSLIQTKTNKIKLYDCTGYLIFDGTTRNSGEYIISHKVVSDDGIALYDGTGFAWSVEEKPYNKNEIDAMLEDYVDAVANVVGGEA